eukprot:scaffold428501_cov19-Prasinocladus_malaysianus.AAC.1
MAAQRKGKWSRGRQSKERHAMNTSTVCSDSLFVRKKFEAMNERLNWTQKQDNVRRVHRQ